MAWSVVLTANIGGIALANFRFTVDTSEMADSVGGVTGHVDGTTAAVVAMGAAVVAAEKSATDEICANVTKGFHSLMRSQISQKSAIAKSTLDAKLLELAYQRQSLLRVKGQMEADFNRISARYTKLFGKLNELLRFRIFELDKSSANLSNNEMGRLSKRRMSQCPKIPVHQLESVAVIQQLAVASFKNDAIRVLDRMKAIVKRTVDLKLVTREIVHSNKCEEQLLFKLPVAFFEHDDISINIRSQSIVVAGSGSGILPSLANIQSLVCKQAPAIHERLDWSAPQDKEWQAVRSACLERLNKSPLQERERALVLRLLDASRWESLGSV